MLNRREFLAGALAAGVAMSAPVHSIAEAADDKLILSVPLTHSDWMLKKNIAWGVDGVRHMLDACKACGWSRVHWRVFDAGQATYASKLLRAAEQPEVDNIFSPQTEEGRAAVKKLLPNLTAQQGANYLKQFETMDYGKFDSLAAAIEYGHSIGLQIHAWATINEDDHGWGWPSEFSKAHPQFRWVKRDGRVYHSQMSFAFPEVREYKLALIRELLDGYAIDGLFIDWIRTGDIRDNPQTDENGVANSGYETPNIEAFRAKYNVDAHEVPNDDPRWLAVRAEPQTLFMRAVRNLVNEHARKVPIAAMVAHPWAYRGTLDKVNGNLAGLLLDVPTWSREHLIDALIPEGYYRDGGTPEMAYQSLKKEAGDVPVWYYAWVAQTPADFERDFAAAKKVGADHLLFWEADYIADRANAAELKKVMSQHARMPA